jgi:hypothetical protein
MEIALWFSIALNVLLSFLVFGMAFQHDRELTILKIKKEAKLIPWNDKTFGKLVFENPKKK